MCDRLNMPSTRLPGLMQHCSDDDSVAFGIVSLLTKSVDRSDSNLSLNCIVFAGYAKVKKEIKKCAKSGSDSFVK